MNFKKYFSNVKNKITIISLVVIVFYVIIGITTYLTTNKVNEIKNFAPLNDISSKYLKLHTSYYKFLFYDKPSVAFLEKGKSIYAENFEKELDVIFTTLSKIELDNRSVDVLSKENKKLLDSIEISLKQYSNKFKTLQKLYRKRGYKSSGEMEILLNSHRRIWTILSRNKVQNFPNYVNIFNEFTYNTKPNKKELINEIEAIELEFKTNSDIVIYNDNIFDFIQRYKQTVNEFYNTNLEIGNYSNSEGVFSEIQELGVFIDTEIINLKKSISQTINNKSARYNYFVIFLIFLISVLTYFVIRLVGRSIILPLLSIKNYTSELAKGKFPTKLFLNNEDEITEMLKSMNQLMDGLKEKDQFAKEIESGNLAAKLLPLSEDDTLSHSLEDMQNSLKVAQEERDKRQEEERKQKWISTGIAEFAAILRQNNDNLNVLGDEIIRSLIHYVNANQGGIFLYQKESDNNDKYMELIASYAYNRKKFLSKRIELGVGLIGNIALEQKMIHLHKLPADYLEITSGLGEAEPSDLVVLPLIFNEVFYGAIEIASFEKLEEYKIEFLKLISDNIASTFASVKVNMQTTKLLQQSNFQAEELASQEEEMRQNMEELQATQEEASRREIILQELVDAIDAANFVIEYDAEGNITKTNSEVETVFNLNKDEFLGKTIFELLGNNELVESILKQVLAGKIVKQIDTVVLKGNTFWLKSTYSPLKSEAGYINKIIHFAYDMTEAKSLEKKVIVENKIIKEQEAELKKKLLDYKEKEVELNNKTIQFAELKRSIDNVLYYAEFDLGLKFKYINKRFLAAIGYSEQEIVKQSYDILTVENETFTGSKILKLLDEKDTLRFKTEIQTKTGNLLKLYLTYSINYDTINAENKIVMIAHEVLEV